MKSLYTIVGIGHRHAHGVVKLLRSGDPLLLEREPDNRYDSGAVKVHAKVGEEWKHIGYVKSAENRTLSSTMDAKAEPGKIGTLSAVYRHVGYHSVEVEE